MATVCKGASLDFMVPCVKRTAQISVTVVTRTPGHVMCAKLVSMATNAFRLAVQTVCLTAMGKSRATRRMVAATVGNVRQDSTVQHVCLPVALTVRIPTALSPLTPAWTVVLLHITDLPVTMYAIRTALHRVAMTTARVQQTASLAGTVIYVTSVAMRHALMANVTGRQECAMYVAYLHHKHYVDNMVRYV